MTESNTFSTRVPAPASSYAAATDNMDRKLTVDELADFLEHVDNFDINTVKFGEQSVTDQLSVCLNGLNTEVIQAFGFKLDGIETFSFSTHSYNLRGVPPALRQFSTPRDLQNLINKKIDDVIAGKEDSGSCDIINRYAAEKTPKSQEAAAAFEKKLEKDLKKN